MNQGDNELRVPVSRLAVQLALTGHSSRHVEVFVAVEKPMTRGRRAVRDLLGQPESFLPAQDTESDEWLLFNKSKLKWISIDNKDMASPELFKDEALELFDRRCAVRVTFEDESALDGEMLFSPPAHGGRVGDHLNRREPYFTLYQAERVFLVNKKAVASVIEIQTKKVLEGSCGED